MLLGYDVLGRPVLGQIGNQASTATTPTPVFSAWSTPQKAGLTVAIVAAFTSFVPPPPARAAPVFTTFSQPQPLRYRPQADLSFEIAPAVLARLGDFSQFDSARPRKAPVAPDWSLMERPLQQQAFVFSSFDVPRPAKKPDQSSISFEITAPQRLPFSGFFEFDGFAPYKNVQVNRGEISFEVYPLPFPTPPGGTSRKLVNGRFVNPLGTARQAPKPAVELKKTPLPPIPAQRKVAEAKRPPPAVIDEAVIPADLVSLEQQVLSAQDVADVQAFLRALDQDEQDAADIAEILAMLDQHDLD